MKKNDKTLLSMIISSKYFKSPSSIKNRVLKESNIVPNSTKSAP